MHAPRTRPRWPAIAALVAALYAPTVFATTLHFLPAEDLMSQAGTVVHGRVVAAEAAWNADRTAILTTVTLEPVEWFKESSETRGLHGSGLDARVRFTVLGGEVDGKLMTYHHRPVFAIGEEVLVFLTGGPGDGLTLMALAQGKWRARPQRGVDGEAVFVRETRGIEFRKNPGNRVTSFDPATARSFWGARELRELASKRVKP